LDFGKRVNIQTLKNPQQIVDRLRQLQRTIRAAVIGGRHQSDPAAVRRISAADTIYSIDAAIEPAIQQYLEHWGKQQPLVLIAEGIEPETGRVFPAGAKEENAEIRLIIDPIDGTRGLMYDKRAAWTLAGVAPNKGIETRLRDIEVAVMTELPTSKMGFGDVLWAIRGQGSHGVRERLDAGAAAPEPLALQSSQAQTIDHGFAMVSNFLPGTKVLASELMEYLVRNLLGEPHQASVFDDQYISTGGQFYEMIVGHDRFNADLRPAFHRLQGGPMGLCCHPYDCATMLIAEEAGVIITDETGRPVDGPLDTTTPLSWISYANLSLRQRIEPLVREFLRSRPV
jgi:fructose-1,6-bisphosphatase/inositol monophosphatase family enzyme